MLELDEPQRLENGRYVVAERPRSPFFRPYQPPTGLPSDRPHASTVSGLAAFCSSALPSGIQSPCSTSIGFALLDGAVPIPAAGPAWSPPRRLPVRARARVAPEGPAVAAVLGRLQPLRPRPEAVADDRGWTEVTFRMQSVEHTAADVLSLGPLIEVVHPPELRERVAELARSTGALYDDPV